MGVRPIASQQSFQMVNRFVGNTWARARGPRPYAVVGTMWARGHGRGEGTSPLRGVGNTWARGHGRGDLAPTRLWEQCGRTWARARGPRPYGCGNNVGGGNTWARARGPRPYVVVGTMWVGDLAPTHGRGRGDLAPTWRRIYVCIACEKRPN